MESFFAEFGLYIVVFVIVDSLLTMWLCWHMYKLGLREKNVQ